MAIRCGVIGVGYLGRFHAQKYQITDGAKLVGVYDGSEARAGEVAKELSCEAFSSVQALLSHVDAVSIAASTAAHFELAEMCLKEGKHVLLEKPMTLEASQAKRLCDLAKSRKLKLQVGHIERFNPIFTALQSDFKKIRFIEATRYAPFKPRGIDANVVFDVMVHDIDLVLSIAKSPVKNVVATGHRFIMKDIDTAFTQIEFESGLQASIQVSRVSPLSERRLRVYSEEKIWDVDLQELSATISTRTGEWNGESVPIVVENRKAEKADALLLEVKAFVNSIQSGNPCVVTGEDGLRSIELAEKIVGLIQSR